MTLTRRCGCSSLKVYSGTKAALAHYSIPHLQTHSPSPYCGSLSLHNPTPSLKVENIFCWVTNLKAAIFNMKLVCDDKTAKLGQNIQIEINNIEGLT